MVCKQGVYQWFIELYRGTTAKNYCFQNENRRYTCSMGGMRLATSGIRLVTVGSPQLYRGTTGTEELQYNNNQNILHHKNKHISFNLIFLPPVN